MILKIQQGFDLKGMPFNFGKIAVNLPEVKKQFTS